MKVAIPANEWNQSLKDIFPYIRSPYREEYAWKINVSFSLEHHHILIFTKQFQLLEGMWGK